MKRNWKKWSAAVAITGALLLMLAVVGFSQGGRPRGGPGHEGGPGGFRGGPGGPGGPGVLEHLSRELNLTDEQKAQIKRIADSAEESTRGLREQLHSLHESQRDILKDGAFDEAAVRAAAQARANLQVELEVAHARTMSQIFALLTPEQKAQLAARRQEFEQKRRERDAERQEKSPND